MTFDSAKAQVWVRLGAGVVLALGGLAVTGGSFGLFAFIGIPMMALGLSMVST